MSRGASVSVLIPTYKDADLLRKSLPVFLENPPDDLEIVRAAASPAMARERSILITSVWRVCPSSTS